MSVKRLLDTRWFVLLVIFGALAGFGLPLLWTSRGFSRPAKLVWTILVILYTWLVVWLIWLLLMWIYAALQREFQGPW